MNSTAPARVSKKIDMHQPSDLEASILIVDADGDSTRELSAGLRAKGFRVEACAGGARLERLLRERDYAVAVCDSDTAGLDVFETALAADPPLAVILLAGFGSIHDAVEAMRAGAFDYISKPASQEQVQVAVVRAIERRVLRDENRRLRADLSQRFEIGNILSRDPRFQRIFQTVEALSDTRATILIEGESGTGKSLLARTIHQRSSRARAPFIEVSCGALPDTLLESELFGHARGAFTGAVKDRPGKFEAAAGGTLFLDEIATASTELQIKLLRVLQDKTFERLGETRTRSADVRVIAATNSDLALEVANGRFREDLYYRIRVVALELPPLRERPGDVALLAQHFLARFAAEYERPTPALSPECLALLTAHPWPGNVRELEHCLERAVLLGQGSLLQPDDLAPEVRKAAVRSGSARDASASFGPDSAVASRLPLREALAAPEREIIRRALLYNHGNRKKTAAMLDVNRTTLFNKMRKYGLMQLSVDEAMAEERDALAVEHDSAGPHRERA